MSNSEIASVLEDDNSQDILESSSLTKLRTLYRKLYIDFKRQREEIRNLTEAVTELEDNVRELNSNRILLNFTMSPVVT